MGDDLSSYWSEDSEPDSSTASNHTAIDMGEDGRPQSGSTGGGSSSTGWKVAFAVVTIALILVSVGSGVGFFFAVTTERFGD